MFLKTILAVAFAASAVGSSAWADSNYLSCSDKKGRDADIMELRHPGHPSLYYVSGDFGRIGRFENVRCSRFSRNTSPTLRCSLKESGSSEYVFLVRLGTGKLQGLIQLYTYGNSARVEKLGTLPCRYTRE